MVAGKEKIMAQSRHATATHLLQAGVDISVIVLWLGHESIDTTHIYIESDRAHKEEALVVCVKRIASYSAWPGRV